MLVAKSSGSARANLNYQILLAFKPRQVLLAERNTKVTTMKQCNSKTLTLNPDQKALLLQSVLGYLERNGFSRALKRLLSEAQIETNWKTCSLNLEDMYGNYLGTCTRDETNLDPYKDQELLTDGTDKKSEYSHSSAIEQTVGNKKKTKSNKGENDALENLYVHGISESSNNSMEIVAKDSLADSTVGLIKKKKKKSKKVSDSLQQREQLSTQALKEPTSDTVSELQIDESNNNQKDKKKKKTKPISKSHYANVERVPLDSIQAVTEEKVCSESEVEREYKDKKKKLKPSTNSLGDNVEHFGLVYKKGSSTYKSGGNVEQGQLESLLVAIEDESKDDNKFDSEVEGKSKDKKKKKSRIRISPIEIVGQHSTALENMRDFFLEKKKAESKEKERKKKRSVSDTLFGDVPNKEDPITRKSKNVSFQILGDANDKQKRSSKKRRRLDSDENDVPLVEKLESEESKRRKIGNLEETKICEQITQVNANAGDDKHAGTESKRENGAVTQYELQNTSIKQTEANGNFEKDGEKSVAQKTRRKQHEGSAEPKMVTAFQRVKIDEVKFADERLQDNSYWAKDGAEVGYGAKAQEILGQVRGRDFRHEKTKKKRGSYRGGQIDLQAHSVKFNYSDED